MPINEARVGSDIRKAFALIVAASLFFAVTSPFNAVTYLPFLARWIYWAGLIAIVVITQWSVWRIEKFQWPSWQLAVLVSIIATPLVLVAILTIQHMIDRTVPQRFWLTLSASIWVINIVLAFVAMQWATPKRGQRLTQSEEAAIESGQGIRDRLPATASGQAIWALGAQDHYLEVILASSKHLIHMRLRDAIAMMADSDGLQVHRSWWVARDAVAKIGRKGRNTEITLRSGQRLPVSRSGARRLREAGWLN
ncbi:MAG: LytTR family DNA-binding domain-containing protein [Pseudomonadota bacterium]